MARGARKIRNQEDEGRPWKTRETNGLLNATAGVTIVATEMMVKILSTPALSALITTCLLFPGGTTAPIRASSGPAAPAEPAFLFSLSERSTGSRLSDIEAQAVLDLHNRYRQEVEVPPLTWSGELAAFAQAWADQLAKTGEFEHRPPTGKWAQQYGENLFLTNRLTQGIDQAARDWYQEKAHYQGAPISYENFGAVGHYTQMVWKGTTEIGCGKAVRKGVLTVVCNYRPRGNILGQSPY